MKIKPQPSRSTGEAIRKSPRPGELRHGLAALAALLLGFWVPVRGAPERPRIAVRPGTLFFGDRGHQERAEGELTIQNAGSAPLEILGIKESCSCIQFEPSRLPSIPPGGSGKLRITMNSGRAMGKLMKKITLTTNDPRAPSVDVPVGMNVLAGFEVTPRELRYTGVVGGEPIAATVDIRQQQISVGPPPPIKLDIDGFRVRYGTSKPENFAATTSYIAGGQRITVTLDPGHGEGRINAELVARLDGKTLVIPVLGEMFAWILVQPTFVNFSGALPGDRSTLVREVRLTSTDGTRFSIREVLEEGGRPARGGSLVEAKFDYDGAARETAHTIRVEMVPAVKEIPRGQTSFFGRVRVVTDHPRKRQIPLTYSGFFAREPAPPKRK